MLRLTLNQEFYIDISESVQDISQWSTIVDTQNDELRSMVSLDEAVITFLSVSAATAGKVETCHHFLCQM